MKLLRNWTVVFATLASVGSLAHAQTAQNGPYYATPSWDQKLRCDTLSTCPRFIVLANWNSEAVLDRETGLVWERSPQNINGFWDRGSSACIGRSVGGRKGWRLPSIQELQSLSDPAVVAPPAFTVLPPGNPFRIAIIDYWSATTNVNASDRAWYINFRTGVVSHVAKGDVKAPWCVRGGSGLDAQ